MNWTPGDGLEIPETWHKIFTPFAGCYQTIATVRNPARMELDKHATSGIRINGGFEGDIIREFAKKLNFTPVVENLTISDKEPDSQTKAIIASCAAGNASIGIGRICLTEILTSKVFASVMYDQECVVWCVPRITHIKRGPFFSEFSWLIWILMGLMFVASFAMEMIVRKTRHLNRSKNHS